jgi:hypothetical protein
MTRCGVLLASLALLLESSGVVGQTTAGTSSTIVFPVIAQTASFGSEVTVFNPNAATITVTPVFYDAQNTATPGPKACTSVSLGTNVTKAFTVATQCALPAGSNFGLLVLTESTGTQRFYGYARTQTPLGVGFSTEGFPIENFNDQLQHAIGLKRVAASGGLPANQTNCFVATLGDAVNYELRLFDGTTNAQLGSTLSGTLAAFQQYRYLDVFALAGVAAGDKTNVRAQFTNLTGSKKKLIGFCTVQENAIFSADFRIAKSYGGTPQNAFVQGGNAFGTTAMLGTTDNQPLTLIANNQPVARYMPNAASPNIVGGYSGNTVDPAHAGQTVAGGGAAGTCLDPVTQTLSIPCANQTSGDYAVIGGGYANRATADYAVVAGGTNNAATLPIATVGGGYRNVATGIESTVSGGALNTASANLATVAGGDGNVASGDRSTVAGGSFNIASGAHSFAAGTNAYADMANCAVFALWSTPTPMNCIGTSNIFRVGANHGFSVEYFSQRVDGGGNRWVLLGDIFANQTISTWTGAFLSNGGVWTNASDRDLKEDFAPVDTRDVLERVASLPVTQWSYRSEPGVRRIGPVAQDFHAAFGLGGNNKTIATGDESGVALAAIQGLHQMMQEKEATIRSLREELDALKRAVLKLTDGGGPFHGVN